MTLSLAEQAAFLEYGLALEPDAKAPKTLRAQVRECNEHLVQYVTRNINMTLRTLSLFAACEGQCTEGMGGYLREDVTPPQMAGVQTVPRRYSFEQHPSCASSHDMSDFSCSARRESFGPTPIETPRLDASEHLQPAMLLVIDGSHVRQMARRQSNGPEIDYERLVAFFQRTYGLFVGEAFFVDTFLESGFEEASLRAADIQVVQGRMKKANYRRVQPPHDMVAVHCQGGVDCRITGLLLTRGIGLLSELPHRRLRHRFDRILLMTSDSDFEFAVQELVEHGKQVTVVGFTTPGNHILCSVAQSYLDITRHWDQIRREVRTHFSSGPQSQPSYRHQHSRHTPRHSSMSLRAVQHGVGMTTTPFTPQQQQHAHLEQQGKCGSYATADTMGTPLIELHLEADDLNRLARTAYVEAQRPDADPVIRTHFPSPWKEHLIPGSLARFSAHMAREHQVVDPALVQALWKHMLRFLPVWGNRNTLLTKQWVEVLVRAAEEGKRSDDEVLSQTFRRMDLITLKRFPCMSSLYVYYAQHSYAKPIMATLSRADLEKVWTHVRSFVSPEQLDVLRRQEYELFTALYPNHDVPYEEFVGTRADSCFASETLEMCGPPSPPLKTREGLGLMNDAYDGTVKQQEGWYVLEAGGQTTGHGKRPPERADSMFGEVSLQKVMLENLVTLLLHGKRGVDLKVALERPEFDWVTGSVLLLAIFKAVAAEKGRENRDSITRSLAAVDWLSWDHFGTALRASLQDDQGEQACALLVVQRMCAFLGFPKCGPDGGEYLIDRLFSLLYTHRFIGRRIFDLWWEAAPDHDRMNVVRQTTSFFASLYLSEPEEEALPIEALPPSCATETDDVPTEAQSVRSPDRPPLQADLRQVLSMADLIEQDGEDSEGDGSWSYGSPTGEEGVDALGLDLTGVGEEGTVPVPGAGLRRGVSDNVLGKRMTSAASPNAATGAKAAADHALLKRVASWHKDRRTVAIAKERLKQTKSALKLVGDGLALQSFMSF